MRSHYTAFDGAKQAARSADCKGLSWAKSFLCKSCRDLAGIIAKNLKQAYTPDPHLPPSQKVSQVEIEAGDSEGRLPQPFCGLNFVVCA